MRKYVLPGAGYKLEGGEWRHATREPIPDAEVESRYSRLTIEVARLEGRDRALRLRDRLRGSLETSDR